jgi:hypothetical protein
MTKQNSIESHLRNVSSFNNGRISNKVVYSGNRNAEIHCHPPPIKLK